MNVVKILALILVAMLLVVEIVDRMRLPAQMKLVFDQQQKVNQALSEQQEALKNLQREVADLKANGVPAPVDTTATTASVATTTVAPVSADPATSASVTADANLDGKPKLGVNFLQPYDTSFFHPEWVGGNLTQFEESPKGLNTIIDNDATATDAANYINDSLCGHGYVHPELWCQGLATAVVISDDYKVYTFTLRHGVMWQRPAISAQPEFAWLAKDVEMTASDFVFAVDIINNPDVESSALKSYYDDLASITAPDPYTLRVEWKKKVYTSLDATLSISPLPRHIYASDRTGKPLPANRVGAEFNKHWFDDLHQSVGVGPYVLDKWEPDNAIVFRRNPAYWGKTYHFQTITWDGVVKDPAAQLVAFKNDQVNSWGLIPQQYQSEIIDHHEPRFAAIDPANPKAGRAGELGWEKVRARAYSYIGWNLKSPLFKDARVRQALSCAFPQQRLIDEVYHGLGRPQRGPLLLDNPYFNPSLPLFLYDLDRAKKLLADAGWTDSDGDGWLDQIIDGQRRPFRFVIKCGAHNPTWDSVLQIYQQELRKLGIDMTTQSYEWKEMTQVYENRDFDGVVGAWQMDLSADFDQIWHSKHIAEPRSSNFISFSDPEVDRLSDELRVTFDLDLRIAIAQRIQMIIQLAQPCTFFRSPEGIFVWQNGGANALAGVTTGLDEYHPLYATEKPLWHLAKP